MSYRDITKAQLRIDEGWKQKPYLDSLGILTIGCGRNLKDRGLRDTEIAFMLDNDVDESEATARALFPSFDTLSDNRKAALLNMALNLGQERLAGFHDFRAAIAAGDFDRASEAMLDSRWADQVGARAVRLSKQIKEG